MTWPQPACVSVNASGAQLAGGVLLRQLSAALHQTNPPAKSAPALSPSQ